MNGYIKKLSACRSAGVSPAFLKTAGIIAVCVPLVCGVCGAQTQQPTSNTPAPSSAQQATTAPSHLSLTDAEQLAIKNHPRIIIAGLQALAARQQQREAKAGLFPTFTANLTGVDTQENSRITAGGLNNPQIFERAAAGVTTSQLITDFGRTANLSAAASLHAKAQQASAVATRADIVLAADQAFYSALSSVALVQVAQQTVQTRQALADQVQALAAAKLRSALDLSFAQVALSQAKLLLLSAQNDRDAAFARLSEAIGLPLAPNTDLQDNSAAATPLGDVDSLIDSALQARPELAAAQYEDQSAQHFATAERRLQLPTVLALGTVGGTPIRNEALHSWFGAVGVNVSIPLFNGFQFSARSAEADLRAQAGAARTKELRDQIVRDVKIAWLNANTASQRQDVAAQLLNQANLSLDLAQARYKLGLGSIVELSQAQLQQTEAQINSVTTKYQFEAATSALHYQLGQMP